MRIAYDTNILAYVAGVKRSSADPAKIAVARNVVAKLNDENDLVVSTQVLGELHNVLTKGGQIERDEARDIVSVFAKRYVVATGTPDCFTAALALAVDHKLQIWDALILATAAEAGCALLLSEDMQDGFTVRGVTVANPFAARPVPQLAGLLEG